MRQSITDFLKKIWILVNIFSLWFVWEMLKGEGGIFSDKHSQTRPLKKCHPIINIGKGTQTKSNFQPYNITNNVWKFDFWQILVLKD